MDSPLDIPIKPAHRRYRPDIDGLRAYAVLSVLFFHVGFERFSGGFVGVDIFFVISGFLITQLIRNDIEAGTFRFSNFYIRRVRRLFPALFFTLTITSILSFFLLSPYHFNQFGGSLVSAVLSLSNFYFWTGSGYFALDADFVPLLHTWSLSVEEQFYLIWPITLVFLLTKGGQRYAFLAVMAAGGVSLFLNEYLIKDHSMIFYMLPFRVFEFAIGAMLVWLITYQPRSPFLLEILALIGFSLIIYPVVFYTEETIFPGVNAVVPCLGTGLLIYAGQARYCGRLLNNPLIVGIGVISYSLYLIHWPILVFYKYQKAMDLAIAEMWLIILVSVFAAIFMYRFVEQPFRRGTKAQRAWSPAQFAAGCAALALIISLPAAAAWAWFSLPGRPIVEVQTIVDVNFDAERISTWQYLNDHGHDVSYEDGATNVIIIGDSHAKDMFNALSLNQDRFPGLNFAMISLDDRCFSNFSSHPVNQDRRQQNCEQRAYEFVHSTLLANASWVLVSPKWSKETIQYLGDIKAFLDGQGISVVVLGNTAEFFDVPTLMFKHGRRDGLESYVAMHRNRALDELNNLVRSAANALDIPYFDKTKLVCSADDGGCDVLDDDGRILFYDYGHWTMAGAKFFGRRFAETGFVDKVLQTGTPRN